VIEPTATLEAEASKLDEAPDRPAVTFNDATGAWSGVMTMPIGSLPTPIVPPAVFVATVKAVTLFKPRPGT